MKWCETIPVLILGSILRVGVPNRNFFLKRGHNMGKRGIKRASSPHLSASPSTPTSSPFSRTQGRGTYAKKRKNNNLNSALDAAAAPVPAPPSALKRGRRAGGAVSDDRQRQATKLINDDKLVRSILLQQQHYIVLTHRSSSANHIALVS